MSLDGVESTQLDFNAGRLTVDYDAADTGPPSMIGALVEAGYGAELADAAKPPSID